MILTDYSVRHGVTVYVLIGVLVIGGLIAYRDLPLEAAPEIDIPVVLVTTPYLGVSPEDIETLVTRPLEKELTEIKEIDVLTSTSAEGASIITVEFTTEANLDEALQEVREKVDLARPKLPKDAEDPIIQEISTTDFPMMIVNVSGEYGIVRLRDAAEDLQEEIEKVGGILEVRLTGGLEREIQVRVDPARLNHYQLSLQHVVDAVRDENLNMPGGDVKLGDASFLVRVPGEYKTVGEIANVVVRLRGDLPVYVRDVAEVHDGFKEKLSTSRLGGRENISLSITKRPGENIVAIADEIKAKLATYQTKMPRNTKLVVLSDASKDIRSMVEELENNMISGMILVIAVIMLTMGFRNSVLVGIAVPLSMLITFVVLAALGITLNMIVLFSLILALGMLVDNAIVIVENIFRHASEGLSPVEAALSGTREVAWAVISSTATTVAVFLPLIFWPGIIGEFMGYLPKTVIITLVASLFVALIVTPVLCAAFLSKPKADSTESSGWFQRFSAAFIKHYERWLTLALQYPARTILIGAAVFVLSVFLYGVSGLGVEFFPNVTPRRMMIDIDTGDGSRFEVSDRVTRRIEAVIDREENIEHYVANVGSGSGQAFMTAKTAIPHKSQMSLDFYEGEGRIESPLLTIERIRAEVGTIPGARVEITKEKMGPPAGAPVQIEVYGEKFEGLGELAEKIRRKIRNVPGLVDLKDDYAVGRPEIRVEIDKERAKILGTGTKKIANTVRTAINGSKASVFRDGDDEYDITVRLREDYRNSLSDIENLRINVASRNNPNIFHLVPIGEVAHLVSGGGTGSIRHKDRKRLVTITGNTEGRLPTDVLDDVKKLLEDYEVPAGYGISYAGEDEDRGEAQAFLGKAFLIALFLMLLILVTQFNSILLPTVIMVAVQMSLVGVLWGQIISRFPFGIIMTGLGVISLAGIVVNNAIVLVDYIQKLRARGMQRTEALIRAGLVRLRPVLLTAITTILGLLPMAFGISIDFHSFSIQTGGQSAEFWRPMSTAVISGLFMATLLTLIFVPVLYAVFDDVEIWFKRLVGGSSDLPSSKPQGEGSP